MQENNEIKALNEQVMNVRLDIRELSTKMDGFKEMKKEVDEASDIANKAYESTKSAHKRLDKNEDDRKWLWRTSFGALATGVIAILLKGWGG